jgi:signal transduction histidine kinase
MGLRNPVAVFVLAALAPVRGRVRSPRRHPPWSGLTGAVLAGGLTALLTRVLARRLTRAARAGAGGDPADGPHPPVSEVHALAQQLRAAADLARAREREARVRERQARAIAEVAHALNASPDLDAVLRTATEAVPRLVQSDAARIGLVDETGRLSLRYSTHASTAMPPGFVIEYGHGIGGTAWATGHPVRTDDIAADPRFADSRYLPMSLADRIVSCLAIPVVTGGAVVGMIYANNFTCRPFTESDEAVLVTLADHAAVAVDKARLLAAEHTARTAAEAASRGKDELLAMLGHELRNPLAAIATAVHVLDNPRARPESIGRAREIIARQNAHLARLVDDLLDVARVTSGKIVLARHPMELAEAVRRTMATLAASGRTDRHRVTLDLEPVWANVDETRLEQIVTNLVGNAVRFTPSGGTIDVVLRAADGDAVLQVRDSGVGITAEMLPRVFDMFVQGARGPAGGPGGLGLGLTLVRRIVELHDGTVEARSDGPGRGSVFTLRVPAIPPPPVARPDPSRHARDGGGRRVVVVEDNADAREMLRAVLELAGHEVREAHDGPSGVEAILGALPDVALVDVGLPAFDGYEVARQVRASVGGGVRLIALTGYGQPDDRRLALEAGFDAHLVKPVEPDTLQAIIEAVPAKA